MNRIKNILAVCRMTGSSCMCPLQGLDARLSHNEQCLGGRFLLGLFLCCGYDPGSTCRGVHFNAVFDLFPVQIDLRPYKLRGLAPRTEFKARTIVEVLPLQFSAALCA
jgi:hypothetical protein